MNDVHHLIALAQRLAEGRIRHSSYTTAERLPAVCKTEPEPPEPEVIVEQISELSGEPKSLTCQSSDLAVAEGSGFRKNFVTS